MVFQPSSASYAASHPLSSSRSVEVTIENTHVAFGETFEMVISISDVSGLGVSAFNMALLYDESLMAATSVSLDGTLSSDAGMTLAFNLNESGRVAIAAAGIDGLTGAGGLAVITFESLSTDGFAEVSFESITLNEGNPAVTGNSATVAISSGLAGDASLNGEVSAFDAAKVLQHAAFVDTLSVPAMLAADVSANNEVSSLDAALILQQVSGLIGCFPVEDGCSAEKTKGVADASFSWGVAAPDGMVVHIPLMIDNINGDIKALTFDVLASEEIDFTYDVSTRLPEGWIVAQGRNKDGHVRVTMAGLTPLSSDTLLVLQAGASSVALNAQIQINERPAAQLDVLDYETLPTNFTLKQNYPNPFNPATTISYALQEDIQVSLVVYDVLGRVVSRLVDGLQRAGIHDVSFNAQSLSSGIYIYKLEAGSFSESRQMMLLK
ncbi:MAG: T9SS type A sorting domain-containing protein [Rhodothermales bacterium]